MLEHDAQQYKGREQNPVKGCNVVVTFCIFIATPCSVLYVYVCVLVCIGLNVFSSGSFFLNQWENDIRREVTRGTSERGLEGASNVNRTSQPTWY